MPSLESPMPRYRLAAPLALLAAGLLAGCGSDEPTFAPTCPQISLLAEGADLTRFTGQGRDILDRVLEGRLTGIDGTCRAGRGSELVATLTVRAELRRGPAAQGRTAQVPYFIAVIEGDRIVDRRSFTLEATFPSNVDSLRVAGDELELRFPDTADRGAGRYRVLVSFQLTQDELAFNRRSAAR
jgi:hypothetical protein